PTFRAVLSINPRAIADARARDAERASGRVRSPFHGVPIVFKDNIDALELPTTGGSRALVDHRPRLDSRVAAGMKQGGAVVLGKANLSEWANFRSTKSSSGWSALGGQAVEVAGPLPPELLTSLQGFAGALWWGGTDEARTYGQALAARPGPILPLITGQPDRAHATEARHVCVDTTASGGNAALLAEAGHT
ncbi:MAG: amidase family protein, partial [Rhodobacteraceae bacterium]|nr:amidase family protein [Paracoccaceae bacterium]